MKFTAALRRRGDRRDVVLNVEDAGSGKTRVYRRHVGGPIVAWGGGSSKPARPKQKRWTLRG